MLKMPISVSDLNDEHLPHAAPWPRRNHKNKNKEIELGTRALMNSVLYARCLVMVDGIHLDRMDIAEWTALVVQVYGTEWSVGWDADV